MLGDADYRAVAAGGFLTITTTNCKPTPPAVAPIPCDGLSAPEFAECPAAAGGTEANTKCMTIKVDYDWRSKPKIAPLPGVFDFLPSHIAASATGKVQ